MKTQTRLALAVGLFSLVLVVQLIGWLAAGSLGLATDALHTGTDLVSLALAALALWVAKWPVTAKHTYGFHRFEVLVRLFNASTLILFLFWVFTTALPRLFFPQPVEGSLMAGAAGFSLVLNGVTVFVLRRSARESKTVKSAYQHVKGDMLLTAGVVGSGVAIHFTGLMILDPLTSMVLAGWVVHDTWEILRDSWDILMEAAPTELDVQVVLKAVAEVRGVRSIHDAHIWKVGSDQLIFTGHVVLDEDQFVSESGMVRYEIEQCLKNLGIHHVTLQLEH